MKRIIAIGAWGAWTLIEMAAERAPLQAAIDAAIGVGCIAVILAFAAAGIGHQRAKRGG